MPPTHLSLDEALRQLHDAYLSKLNAAIGDGRSDLISELSSEYLDDAQRTLMAGRRPV